MYLNIVFQEAIASNSFYDSYDHELKLGKPEDTFAECDHVTEGSVSIGGQLHFCHETHVCLVLPGEDYEMDIWAPNHSLSSLQVYRT